MQKIIKENKGKELAKTSEIRRANRKISVCNEHEKD
jgi:hypothetical protein